MYHRAVSQGEAGPEQGPTVAGHLVTIMVEQSMQGPHCAVSSTPCRQPPFMPSSVCDNKFSTPAQRLSRAGYKQDVHPCIPPQLRDPVYCSSPDPFRGYFDVSAQGNPSPVGHGSVRAPAIFHSSLDAAGADDTLKTAQRIQVLSHPTSFREIRSFIQRRRDEIFSVNV